MSQSSENGEKARAIVTIAHFLLETIFVMLTRKEELVERIDDFTRRKNKSMSEMEKCRGKEKGSDQVLEFIIEREKWKATRGNFPQKLLDK